jgi:predicted phosphate transport protein (TIGR00153 family)
MPVLRFFQALMPREEKFFAQFNDHARTLVDGAVALRDLLEGGPGVPEACRRIAQHEDRADAITRAVLVGLRRTFITPFDRGDMKELINQLDDAIDQMKKTAKAITLFEVESFELQMRQMADIILRCAELTVEAVGLLDALRNNVTRINAIAEEITRLEEQADDLNDAGIKALYQRHKDGNAMAFIVGAEIYDHLEKVVDRFEDVANRISGIVIEQV